MTRHSPVTAKGGQAILRSPWEPGPLRLQWEEVGYWADGLAFSWSLLVMWLAHVGFMFNAVLIIRKSPPASCTFIKSDHILYIEKSRSTYECSR